MERAHLMETLALVPKRSMAVGDLNAAGWSVKDVLAHLFDWETRVLDWYEAGVRGEQPNLPAPGFTWKELPALNEQIHKRHRRQPIADVLGEFAAVHQRTLAAIERMSDDELTTLNHYSWTGKSWTLSDYLRGNTASHYRWARQKIRKWLRSRSAGKS